METHDVAILGAGPYGLSAAAYLRHLRGLDARVFGEPMSFWAHHMPVGMRLRSRQATLHIADPRKRLSLDVYRTVNGNHELKDPLSVEDFVEYGHWFHQEAGVAADRRKVIQIELAPKGYQLTLEDGEALEARRVVVAAGIQPFAHRPGMFEGLPASLVTHSSEQRDYRKFRGKEVLVIGGGQSALEAAAFLHEAGAHAEILIRKGVSHGPDSVLLCLKNWLNNRPWMRVFHGRGGVGPAGISLVIQRPNLFRRLPRRIQDSWDKRAIRPMFTYRLVPDTQGVPIRAGRFVVQARVEGDHLHVRLDDGTERTVDHLVLGTGYRVNVALYSFLSSRVLERLDLVNGYPRLDSGFESSLPGLHFLGSPAAWSFGPLVRFIAGTEFASRALRRRILRAKKR